MSKLFRLLNPKIGLNANQRVWLELGQSLPIGKGRAYRLLNIRSGEKTQPAFAEEIFGHTMKYHDIEDGHWRCETVREGYLEIIPKAVRYDQSGRVDAVLVDLLLTPASMVSGQV